MQLLGYFCHLIALILDYKNEKGIRVTDIAKETQFK